MFTLHSLSAVVPGEFRAGALEIITLDSGLSAGMDCLLADRHSL
jgi:hypothetical protein